MSRVTILLLVVGCAEKQRPNIIFIMSDDHACKAISAYDTTLITFPKLLQEAGYETAMIGKWHLKTQPMGFDYWNVLPGQGAYYNPDMIEMGKKSRHSGYVTDIITENAIQWLEERDEGQPFCLMMHHKAPHRNWMPRLDLANAFDSVLFPLPENFHDDYSGRSDAAREQRMSIARDMWLGYDLKISKGPGRDEIIEDGWLGEFNRMNEEQRAGWNKAYPGIHDVKRHYGIRTQRYKLIHFYHDIDQWELYDLEKDPAEMNNLYGDDDYQDVIDSLKIRLMELRDYYKVPSIQEEFSVNTEH